jgi:glutaredoxin
MKINLYIANNCPSCERVEKKINSFNSQKQISIAVTNIEDIVDFPVPIVPALYIDGNLFAYGDFDINRLNNFINK